MFPDVAGFANTKAGESIAVTGRHFMQERRKECWLLVRKTVNSTTPFAKSKVNTHLFGKFRNVFGNTNKTKRYPKLRLIT